MESRSKVLVIMVDIVIGEEKLILVPQKVLRRAVVAGEEQNFEVMLPGADRKTTGIYSGTLVQNPGERGLVQIYQADGVSARRPLKVTLRRELVPENSKPEAGR